MKKGLIITSTLALLFGVGVAVGAHQEKVAKVEAFDADDYVYLRLYNTFWEESATGWLNYQDSSNDWHNDQFDQNDAITTKGGESLYKVRLSFEAKNLQVLRKNADASQQWGYSDLRDAGSINLYSVTGYSGEGGHMDGNFASASVNHVTVTAPQHGSIAVSGAHNEDEGTGEGYYYSDWTITLTATPASGYEFVNWTTADGTDWTGEDKSNNPVVLNNISGEFGVSAKFQEAAHSYKVVIGGVEYPMNPHEKGDHDAQYKVIADVSKGEGISFLEDDSPLAATVPNVDENNNAHGPTNSVLEDKEDADIYLKKDGENWTYYVSGRTAKYYAIINNEKAIKLEKNGDKNEYKAMSLQLKQEDTIKLYAYGASNYNGKVKDGSEGATVVEGVIEINEAGTFNIYYEPSEDNFIYFEMIHTYRVRIITPGELEPTYYDFVEVDKGDYEKQFKAIINVNISQAIGVYDGNTILTLSPEEGREQYSNVLWANGQTATLFPGENVDCYLKYKNSKWHIYVGGRQSEYVGIYTTGMNGNVHKLLDNPDPEHSDEVMITNLTVEKDSYFLIYRTAYAAISEVECNPEIEGAAIKDTLQTGPTSYSDVVKFATAGTYNLYINKSTGHVYVDKPTSADAAAIEYAETFLETLSTGAEAVCNAQGNTNQEALTTAWASLKTAFNAIGGEDAGLKATAQNILRVTSKEAEGKVGQFAALYEYIIEKYGSNNYEDFVNRYNGNAPVVGPKGTTAFETSVTANFTVIMIMIATVSTIGVGAFFILKRRHH